jgi:zinc transporter, ZIP family
MAQSREAGTREQPRSRPHARRVRGSPLRGVEVRAERTAFGALAGGVFIFVSQGLIDSHKASHLGSLKGADARKALLIVEILIIHSFAEGVGVGVAFGVAETLGILIGLRA